MTPFQFKTAHTKSPYPYRGTGILNVNVNLKSGTYHISQFSISAMDLNNTLQDSYLENVEKITFTFTSSQAPFRSTQVELKITSKEYLPPLTLLPGHYIFNCEEFDTTFTETELSFTSNGRDLNINNNVLANPRIANLNFEYSEYNALISNSTNLRTSTLYRVSDRSNTNQNPTNISAILNDTANLANIQDSNYNSTGWFNSRYGGSKTGELQASYGNIPAIVQGSSFIGELFPTTAEITKIFNLSERQTTPETFIHLGSTELPEFVYTVNETVELFKIESNRIRRLQESLLYITDLDVIFELDNTGTAIQKIVRPT